MRAHLKAGEDEEELPEHLRYLVTRVPSPKARAGGRWGGALLLGVGN